MSAAGSSVGTRFLLFTYKLLGGCIERSHRLPAKLRWITLCIKRDDTIKKGLNLLK